MFGGDQTRIDLEAAGADGVVVIPAAKLRRRGTCAPAAGGDRRRIGVHLLEHDHAVRDALDVRVVIMRGEIVEQHHRAAAAIEILLQRQDLPPIAERASGQQPELGQRVDHHARRAETLDVGEHLLRRGGELHLGQMEHRRRLHPGSSASSDGMISRSVTPSRDQPCDCGDGAELFDGLRQRDVEDRLAAARAGPQELQRERRLARAGNAFEQVRAIPAKAAGQDVIQSGDAAADDVSDAFPMPDIGSSSWHVRSSSAQAHRSRTHRAVLSKIGAGSESQATMEGVPSRVEHEVLTVAGREVPISNPRKVLFPQAGYTKLDVARYYVAVADGALRAAGDRPNVLVRYPNGIDGEFFYQKRAPESRPDWIEVVALKFPSGRTAEEVVPRDAAALVWMANLACLELHPHPVRADDLDHPDELRIDLDPVPGVEWPQIRAVAGVVRATLADLGLVGWPKTSGSRGIHINVRIERRWTFTEVRRAALAFAREVERRAPDLATSKWWKEERHGVFLDYNQNAKDRTVAAAYSVRPKPDARVSAPLAWDEIDACEPGDFTLATMPARFASVGDRHADIDQHPASLTGAARARRRVTRRKASATRHGRRTTRSSPTSRRASNRRSGGCRSIR